MSGEKCGKWRVVEPGDPTAVTWQQANQTLAEYINKSEALRRRLEGLAAQYPDMKIMFTDADPAGGPPATVEALVEALNAVQSRHNQRHHELQRVETAIEERKQAELAAEQRRRIDAILTKALSGAGEARWQKLRESAPATLLKLELDVDPARRAAIERMVQDALNLESKDVGRLEGLIKSIKQAIGDANNDSRAKKTYRKLEREAVEKDAQRAVRLMGELAGARSDEAAGVLSDLQKVERQGLRLSADLIARAETAIVQAKEARAERDRAKAVDILGRGLLELGYTLQQGFATAFAQGETTYQRPEWEKEGYFCRVKVDAKTQEISMRMLCDAEGQADRARDRKVDASWCQSMGELQKRLAAKGMTLPLSPREPASAEPVEHVRKRSATTQLGQGAGIAIERTLPGQ
jgi:hypothetical protein